MVDVAEILKFKEYKDKYGCDDYYYGAIVGQLRGAIKNGHDVQLHIHSSYFNARHENGCWPGRKARLLAITRRVFLLSLGGGVRNADCRLRNADWKEYKSEIPNAKSEIWMADACGAI